MYDPYIYSVVHNYLHHGLFSIFRVMYNVSSFLDTGYQCSCLLDERQQYSHLHKVRSRWSTELVKPLTKNDLLCCWMLRRNDYFDVSLNQLQFFNVRIWFVEVATASCCYKSELIRNDQQLDPEQTRLYSILQDEPASVELLTIFSYSVKQNHHYKNLIEGERCMCAMGPKSQSFL